MALVAPSILAADFARLGEECREVLCPEAPILHFDVMDGVFVPNISVGLPVLESLKKAIPGARYDVHLMIQDPLRYAGAFASAGADNITFHLEAESDPAATIAAIREAGCQVGVSLRPGTPVEQVFPLLGQVDLVLVMSVEPGFGGQAFQPEALTRISALRDRATALGTSLTIEVDGGIDETTGPACIEAGADLLVAGSAVFGHPNPQSRVKEILGRQV